MAAFPGSLPEPLLDSYGIEPQSVTARTDMEAGPARVRRRFTSQVDNITTSWILTSAQVTTFKTFFDTDIKDGSEWFDINLDLGSGSNVPCECRFIERYSLRALGFGVWRIDARLERR